MTERDRALERFDALIATWATEATHPLFDGVVPGSITFEWFEGGQFLVQRSHNDHELFPDAITVIGARETGQGLVMEYFDSRGVPGPTASRSTTACCAYGAMTPRSPSASAPRWGRITSRANGKSPAPRATGRTTSG